MIFCQGGDKVNSISSSHASNNKPDNRVFVLGLDGFTLDLAIPWMEQGKLPNLKKFIRKYSWGYLESVPPYNSPTAWGSAITGVNPGKHGVFGFFQSSQLRNDFSKKKIYFINSYDYKSPFIWDLVSRTGLKLVAVNVPGSSPPQPVNGVLVAGQPYADNSPLMYPPEIEDEIPYFKMEEFSHYCQEGKEDEWLQECYEIERERVRSMFTLMESQDWDLFWVVLTSPDRVQHHFWKYMDPNHPLYTKEKEKKYGTEIYKIYKYMDEVVGQLLSKLPRDAILIILSDHGFGPVYKSINVADFLFGDKYLTNLLSRTIKVNYNSFFSGAFYINLKIREPHGSVSTEDYEEIRHYLVKKLKDIKDPQTNQPVIDKIYMREEIYSGQYSFMAPDVFCLEKPTYLFSGIKVKPDGSLISVFPSFAISGGHRPNGIIAIGGNPIRNNMKISNPKIIDITPTVLYFLGLEIPDYMDGKILQQAITEKYLDQHKPKISGTQVSSDKELLDRLKKLGYVK